LMGDIGLLAADTSVIPETLPKLHQVHDEWSCIGMLYVLHGARFGAQVMHADVCQSLPDLPHHYLSHPVSHDQWRALVLHLERVADAPAQIDVTASSAAETFSAFYDWILDV